MLRPRGRIVVSIDAKILNDEFVDNFHITISLRMEGSGKFGISIKMIPKMFPKGRDKLRTTIGNDGFRKTMKANDVMKKEFHCVSSGNGSMTGDKVSELSEMIFDNKNAIKLVRKRQTGDGKRMRRNRIEET
jgi:hypothetical protein